MRYLPLLVLLAGCASVGEMLGLAPSPEMARVYGCDHDAVLAEWREREAPAVPRVGWTACDVLGRTGKPKRTDRSETAYGFSERWWFPDPINGMYEPKLVTLRYTDGEWVVDYVGW